MTQAYLITFRPAGHFFFGGPVGFSDGFFVQSGYFPQPTTVMGALRAALLTGGGLLQQHRHGRFVPKAKKPEAEKLVGTARLNNFEEKPDFGIIRSLSPVFMVTLNEKKPADAFFPTPADVVKNGGQFRLLKSEWLHSEEKNNDESQECLRVNNCGRESENLFVSGFDPKNDDRGPFLGGADFWKAYKNKRLDGSNLLPFGYDDEEKEEDTGPFRPRRQVGIGLKQRRTEEGRFYVKTEFDLSPGWAFAAIVHLDTDKPELPKTIFLGGDQSVFFLECKAIKEGNSLFTEHPLLKRLIQGVGKISESGEKAVAISPLILENGHPLTKKAEHAVISRIDRVRMLHSVSKLPPKKKNGDPAEEDKTDSENIKQHFRNGKRILKSDAYRSMPAGSVFYAKPGKKFDDIQAEKPTALVHSIGYNHLIYL